MEDITHTLALLRLERAQRRAHLPTSAAQGAGFALMLEAADYHLRGDRAQTTGLGISAGLPHGVAFRHLSALCDDGMIARAHDPHDARRRYAFLTDQGARALRDHLRAIQEKTQ